MSRKISRRQSLRVAATSLAAPWIVPRHVLGGAGRTAPNDRIEIGLIGVGVRGKYLLANLPESVQVTALCDFSDEQVDSALRPQGGFEKILADFATHQGPAAVRYRDYRRLIDEHAMDAVIVATPDHHHAQAAILAMQAGCDVYVEKPLAVTIGEGQALVQAARKFKRVVQVGSQQRTMQVNRTACEFIRSGGLGNISLVEERNLPGPMPYQANDFPGQPVPASLDWDLFCGPTPLRPYHPDLWIKDAYKFGYLTWRGWDLFEDYSGHLMTNWGAHSVDMVQYALGMDNSGPVHLKPLPRQIDNFIDDQYHEKTPPLGTLKSRERDRMRFCPVEMTYANGVSLRFTPGVRKTIFYGEHGTLELSRNKYVVDPTDLLPPPDKRELERWDGSGHVARPHLENWLQAVRTRGEVNAPIEVGHRSVTVCHLANIVRLLGRELRWDPVTETFPEDDQANALLHRPRRSGFELPSL